jgi:hypothetical protein
MNLPESEIANLLKSFPSIKLSYETFTHKKVYDADYMLTIPEGKRCFAWFSVYRNKNVCYLLEVESDKNISCIKIINACFNDELCYGSGTIIYGTLFINNNLRIFNIQDLFYYKGKQLLNLNTSETFNIYSDIFKTDIKQTAYSRNFVLFGLPLISKNFSDLLQKIELLPYPVKYIQCRYLKKPDIYNMNYVKPNSQYVSKNKVNKGYGYSQESVFKVKAEIQNDIYNLYVKSKSAETNDYFFDIAYIPDYKTSVMMNNLFRKIKENRNLDALEESDSEEEFENDKIDKFVFLERILYMVCIYNSKFRKWVPFRLANKDEKLVEISALQQSQT